MTHKRRPPREPAKNGVDFQDLLAEGTRALQQGQIAAAVAMLQRAHQLKPEHNDAALNLAGAYILSKQFGKAVELLEPLSEREPDNPMIWTNLGAAYLGNPILARDEHHQQAIAAFKKAIDLDPKAPHVAYNLGLIYRDRQQTDQALHWFRQALAANPADKDARRFIQQLSAGQEDE